MCGYSWPNFVSKNGNCLMVLYGSFTYFEGLSKSFAKIFSPLIEENFYKIVVSDYYSATTAICCVSYSRDLTSIRPRYCSLNAE